MPSLVTNAMAQQQQGAAQGQSIAAQQGQQNLMNRVLQYYLNIAGSPGATMTGAMGSVPALSPGAIEGLQNTVQANMATHGFSQAPDMWQAALSKALGNAMLPLQQTGFQNYQTGQTLPLGVPQPQISNYSGQQISDPLTAGIGTGVGMGVGTGLGAAMLA